MSAEGEEPIQELIYLYKSLQSPQRKATAIMLLKALVAEEENEQRGDGKGR